MTNPEKPENKYGYGIGERSVGPERIVGHGGGFPGINGQLDIYWSSGCAVAVLSKLRSSGRGKRGGADPEPDPAEVVGRNGGLGMMDIKKRFWVGIGLASALLSAGSLASAEEVFTATLTAARGLGRKTAELTLTVTSRTTEEDAARLQKILEEQGSDAAIAELRKFDRGVAKITGGPSSPIRHMRSHVGQNGARVIIMTDSPLYFPEDAPSPSSISKKSIGLIELVVDNTGKGRGSMVEALEVNLTEDGVFQVVTPGAQKIDLENVRQKR